MKRKIIWIILAILIVIAAGTGWKAYSEYKTWTSPWGTEDRTFTMEIEEGKSAHQIAEALKQKGVLHSTNMFLIMADLRGIGGKLKAGEYEFKGTQSPYEILDMLATGKQYFRSLVIPEGFTQVEMAQRCAEMGICSATAFLNECRQKSIFKFVIAQPPNGVNPTLEGILYPDTYYLFKNTPPIKVLDRMTKKFEEVVKPLYDAAIKKKEERGAPWWWESDSSAYAVQIHKIVVLASIIEKEAGNPADRPLIASAFVNRIKKNMPLQSDSTIHYVLNDWSRPLKSEDLKIDSQYNTYANTGLPPSAICNPGKDCIQAAMTPADTNYIYFITMNDGETKFTASYDEFLKWKNQYKKDRRNSTASN